MIIGILTYHKSHNFGALAQAIALRKTIASMGYDVYYINYWPDYHQAMYALFSLKDFMRQPSLRMKWRYLKRKWRDYPIKKTSYRRYNQFIAKYILPYCRGEGMQYDCIIYGSDQIWRKQPWMGTYNPVYFAKNHFNTKKNVAYAASMGNTDLSISDKVQLKTLLSNFDKIAVRESNLKMLVNDLGYSCKLTVDPALLLNQNQWDNIIPTTESSQKTGYVLFVNYMNGSFDESILRRYAVERKLSFVKVNGSVVGKDTPDAITDAGPKELVNFIRNANVVFTSSFHAMIFSIIYKKDFFAGFSNNFGRAQSILQCLGIENRLVRNITMQDLLDKSLIDYDSVTEKLENLISPSLEYLYSSLNIK